LEAGKMNRLKSHLILLLSALTIVSGYSTTNEIRLDAEITAEQKKAALALAKEFGIENVHRIYTPFPPTLTRYLMVRGDEQIEGNIGRYKELRIFFEERTYAFDPPQKITPSLCDCSLRIAEFVELEIAGSKKRVLTKNVNPELALKLLTKIYNSDYTLAPGVDSKEHPSKKLLMHDSAWLERRTGWESVLYDFELGHSTVITFSADKGNIVIQEYSWHIH
jgi:hypothetical protein